MRGVYFLFFMLVVCAAHGQQTPGTPANPQPAFGSSASAELPDAPGQDKQQQQSVVAVAEAAWKANNSNYDHCTITRAMNVAGFGSKKNDSDKIEPAPRPCNELFNSYQRFLTTNVPIPLSPKEKGLLAIHNITDPANLATIAAVSAVTIAVDPDSAYGPGFKGFALNAGVSLLQDATGEFFGTFAIPSLIHEDPRYQRMPHASIPRRTLHAISRTVIAQSDHGKNMPNYAILLAYPINAELSNLYVPGIESDARSTTVRIFTGYALDPVNNLLTEFIPDLASRVHIRIIVVQRILNQISSTPGGTTFSFP